MKDPHRCGTSPVLGGNYVGTLAGEAGTAAPGADTWIEGVVVDGGSVTAEGDYAGGLLRLDAAE